MDNPSGEALAATRRRVMQHRETLASDSSAKGLVMHYLPYLVIVLLSGVCIYFMHILS